MSAVHVAFEINPATELIILSVRSKRVSSVRFAVCSSEDTEKTVQEVLRGESPAQEVLGDDVTREEITGDGVILYGQNYDIFIASYEFRLLWLSGGTEPLKALIIQGYRTSLQLL
ncbi:hypothetical protein QBC46DRAFT_21003 [Diplogelasinospora grovesii]|uniref:Uncharacterized protein n=1 Tax=Diplogelasinospora grovesii TaxID=303347 RepID=A0AAN6N3W4_9PEZI|nr:hypothetical protein QBC46DRAFT_21003 [Diplogelasinospora grovesii]